MNHPFTSYRINSLVSLYRVLEFVTPLFGPRDALTDGQQRLSYQSLLAAARRTAAVLAAQGVGKESRVLIYAPKSIATVQAILACNALGATFIPANPQLKPAQIAHMIEDSGCGLVLSTKARLGQLAAADALGSVRTLQIEVAEAGSDGPVPRPATLTDGDPAAILYTSGSTGQPKGVVLTQRNVVSGALSVADYLGLTPDDRILGVLPLSFDAGLSQLTTALAAGACYVVHEFLAAAQTARLCLQERVTVITCVPPVWYLLADVEWDRACQVRLIANTGGHMNAALLARLRAAFPRATPYLMYGLTESFRSCYLEPAMLDERPDSIGTAVPNAEILVVRPDGSECAAGETGELVHRGAFVTLGYLNQDMRSAERFRPWPKRVAGISRPEMAVWSGDLVRRDASGHLYFIGRTDEQIKTSGHRVSPHEIENVLLGCPGVARAVVAGLPDERLGQRIVACVVPDDRFDAVRLGAHCKAALPRHLQPSELQVFDAFPLNPNGKVDRPAVLRQARERAALEAV